MNNMMHAKSVLSTLLVALSLGMVGCSKESRDENKGDAPHTEKPSAQQKEAPKQQLNKADKATPTDKYVEMNSGKQLMFAYLAADTLPIDYEKIAGHISQDFRSQSDEFKRRDLLNALKTGIDAEVAKAKAAGYYHMTFSDDIEKYNFDSKSFAHPGFSEGGYRYFYDLGAYKLKFVNTEAYRNLKVTDENLAREIESLRSKGNNNLETEVYFYVGGTELGSEYALAEITKIVLKTKSGKKLIEI